MSRFREPTLIDLLNDPIIHLVMRADRVSTTDILDLYSTSDDIPADNPPTYICSRLLESANRLKTPPESAIVPARKNG